MATAASEEDNEKKCSVCNELFTEPKLLPCGDLLCQDCVLSLLKKEQDSSCPVCKSPVVDTRKWGSGEIDFEAYADSLPTDLAMKALVDAERILTKQHKCQGCKNVAATVICLHCGDLFCSACSNIHKNMTSTKRHVVEELSSLTPEKLAAKRCEDPCAVHAEESAKVFCPKHGTSICIVCAYTDHRQCPDVTPLETKMVEAQDILKELAATLSQGEARLDRGLSDLEQHMASVEKKTQAAIAEIEETFNRLESAVKTCRRRLKEQTQGASGDVKEAVNGGKDALLSRKGKLTAHRKAVERAQGMTSRSGVTRMTEALQARVKELDDSVTLPTEVKDMKEVTLTIDIKVVSHVEQLLQDGLKDIKKNPTLTFHHKCGDDVILSNNQLTAEKQRRHSEGGLVMAKEPMIVNRLYELQVDELWDKPDSRMLVVGVLTSPPDTVTIPVSGRAYVPLWSEAIVLIYNCVVINMKQVPSTLGQALLNMMEGSCVGLSLNDKRDLLLYRDGQLKGTITTAVPDPVYPLFHVNQRYRQITALPVTKLN